MASLTSNASFRLVFGVLVIAYCVASVLVTVPKAFAADGTGRDIGPMRTNLNLQGIPGDADDVGGYRNHFSQDDQDVPVCSYDSYFQNSSSGHADTERKTYTIDLYLRLFLIGFFPF
jgi:hypothetical protein